MTEPIKYDLSPAQIRVIRDRIFGFRDTKAVLSPFLTDVSEDAITATQEEDYIVVDFAYHRHQGEARKRVRKHLYLRWLKTRSDALLSFNRDHIEVSSKKFPIPKPFATATQVVPRLEPQEMPLQERLLRDLDVLITRWEDMARAMGCESQGLVDLSRARATSMRAREVMAQKASADWTKPTTKLQRMSDAVTLLCDGKRPSDSLVQGWLDKTNEGLQEFAAVHGPSWAQGIGLLDAAAVMADQPTEDVPHLDVPSTPTF